MDSMSSAIGGPELPFSNARKVTGLRLPWNVKK